MTDTHTLPANGRANVQPVDDIHARGIFITGLGLIALVVLACLVVFLQFSTLKTQENQAKESPYPLGEEERKRPLEQRWPDDPRFKEAEKEMSPYSREDQPLPWSFPKEPRLEGLDTPIDLNHPLESGVKGWPSLAPQQAEKENKQLDAPAWANKEAGTVILPIDEVMKRLAANLPVRSSSADVRKADRYYQTPSAANSGRPPEGGKP